MARSNLKEYDVLLIYNHEDSSYSDGDTREDSSLLFSYVDFVNRELNSCNYSIHHLDRDSIPGRSVFYELERVIESSQVILLILDKGFLKNSWKCFSQEAVIKNLIDASTDPKCTTSNRLIPIFICLEKNEIPSPLKTLTPIEIMGESDITEKWKNLEIAIDWHFRPERIPRSIVAKNSKSSQLTPEYASAVSKEPRSNPISNGPSSRSAILPNQNTVNTPDSLSTDTSIDGSSSMSHSYTEDEDITVPKETAATVTPGTLRLQSTELEPDALQSMTPTAATIQQFVASPQNHSSTSSLSQSTPDSDIGLMSPELGSLNVASFLHEDEQPESLFPSNQIANSVTLQDEPDSAVNQSPEGPNTDTSIDGSSSMSHSCTEDEDITVPKETAATVTPGTLRLQSTELELDALQSMSPTAATIQQFVASPQNHSSTPSLSLSTPDSGIELSPELGPLNVASVLHEDEPPESFFPSNQIANTVTLQDEPDSAVNQSPEGPNTEDEERPSFFSRAVHFLIHAIFQPDKVYAPP